MLKSLYWPLTGLRDKGVEIFATSSPLTSVRLPACMVFIVLLFSSRSRHWANTCSFVGGITAFESSPLEKKNKVQKYIKCCLYKSIVAAGVWTSLSCGWKRGGLNWQVMHLSFVTSTYLCFFVLSVTAVTREKLIKLAEHATNTNMRTHTH